MIKREAGNDMNQSNINSFREPIQQLPLSFLCLSYLYYRCLKMDTTQMKIVYFSLTETNICLRLSKGFSLCLLVTFSCPVRFVSPPGSSLPSREVLHLFTPVSCAFLACPTKGTSFCLSPTLCSDGRL